MSGVQTDTFTELLIIVFTEWINTTTEKNPTILLFQAAAQLFFTPIAMCCGGVVASSTREEGRGKKKGRKANTCTSPLAIFDTSVKNSDTERGRGRRRVRKAKQIASVGLSLRRRCVLPAVSSHPSVRPSVRRRAPTAGLLFFSLTNGNFTVLRQSAAGSHHPSPSPLGPQVPGPELNQGWSA